MSDGFSQNKRRFGKGLSYCLINSGFGVMFGLGLFTLGKNQCYTIKGSDYPVDPIVHPEANDVTYWYNMTLLLGFIFYCTAAMSSLGYLTKQGFLNSCSAYTEKLARVLTYIVFIAVHVMRLSHTGSVCAGDFLPEEERSDENVKGYMIKTGNFFMTYIILGWIVVPAMLIVMVCLKGEKWAALALDAPK